MEISQKQILSRVKRRIELALDKTTHPGAKRDLRIAKSYIEESIRVLEQLGDYKYECIVNTVYEDFGGEPFGQSVVDEDKMTEGAKRLKF